MSRAVELNLDGLVGPTHNYAGLSYGNVASVTHAGEASNPRAAALQGIAKMRRVVELGVPQAVLPPHERPDVASLRRLGFTGSDGDVLQRAAREDPRLVSASASASAMWAANAATVAPSADTPDGRVHITPANLVSTLHRSMEPPTTSRLLAAIFPDPARFSHHPALPASAALGDEGAANHTRLAESHGAPGVHLFVHGRTGAAAGGTRFPARQTRIAHEAIARLHGLAEDRVVHALQAPEAIDAGAFHNDVVCVGNESLLLHHERAFADTRRTLDALRRAFAGVAKRDLVVVTVAQTDLTLDDAVASYLFNGQLLTHANGSVVLMAPSECREIPTASRVLDALVDDPEVPIDAVHVVDTRQSMRNGGGPACLRLRVVLTEEELAAMAPGVVADGALLDRLEDWVGRHYRDRLTEADLADPALLDEGRRALDDLTGILGLGSVYPFQSG